MSIYGFEVLGKKNAKFNVFLVEEIVANIQKIWIKCNF